MTFNKKYIPPAHSQQGLTIAELVISITILSLVVLVTFEGLRLIHRTQFQFQGTVEQKTDFYMLEKVLSLHIGQAIEVDWTNTRIENIDLGRGKIRAYQSGLANTKDKPPVALGVFLREAGSPMSGAPSSKILASAVYFKEPTPFQSGELLIASSRNNSGQVTLNSEDADFRFKSLTQVRITSGGYKSKAGEPARVAKIETWQRKFTTPNKKSWRWCPQSLISKRSSCKSSASFRDVKSTLYITITNNSFDTGVLSSTGTTQKESVYGDTYNFTTLKGVSGP